MNVLSLFDGISCGQVALQKAGIEINKYYASEIDQRAITVTQRNFPKTIQFGNVQKIHHYHFLNEINLIMGGSPCQGFSFAGKMLNFDDPRSKLFFEFVRLKTELQPQYFFLENVKMAKDSENIISDYLKVEPIRFNSMLVSAQSRERLYWTNIPYFEIPQDKRIVISDILDNGFRKSFDYEPNDLHYDAKSFTRCIKVGHDMTTVYEQGQRVYSKNAKAPTIDTKQGGNRSTKVSQSDGKYIKLNINELERLQGLPDNYTKCVSRHAAQHGIGNGWQVDTIVEFFKHLKQQ